MGSHQTTKPETRPESPLRYMSGTLLLILRNSGTLLVNTKSGMGGFALSRDPAGAWHSLYAKARTAGLVQMGCTVNSVLPVAQWCIELQVLLGSCRACPGSHHANACPAGHRHRCLLAAGARLPHGADQVAGRPGRCAVCMYPGDSASMLELRLTHQASCSHIYLQPVLCVAVSKGQHGHEV